jgi:hypothetical protein
VAVVETGSLGGVRVRETTDGEGRSVHEAVEWCGYPITTREATRLHRLAEDD